MSDTRQEILKAAFKEFLHNGYDGTRMQAITSRTGVTKAMIHYYFGDKQTLFSETYKTAVADLLEDLFPVLEEDLSLYEKIERFIEELLHRAGKHPETISFVIEELNRNEEMTRPILEEYIQLNLEPFEGQLEEAASNYKIIQIDPRQLIMNMFSLCLFPYAARGLFGILFDTASKSEYEQLMNERRGFITDIILNSLTS